MPMSTRFKESSLGQLPDLMASSRDGATYRPWRVVEYRQGKPVLFRSEEVGSPSQAGSFVNGTQSTPVYGIWKCKNKRCLTYRKLSVTTNFLPSLTKKLIK